MEGNNLNMEASTLELIWRGLVIGIGAGSANALIFAAYNKWHKHRSRREQVKFIRSYITENFTRIENAQELPHPAPGKEPISEHEMRYVFFRGLQREIEVTASYRTTALEYSQISDLHQAIEASNKLLEDLGMPEQRLPDIRMYRSIYENYAKIDWLKLPKTLPQ